MTKGEWETLFVEAINSLKEQMFVPYDTGNLKFNAIKGFWVDDSTFRIYIDEKVAPYVYFTNEVWKKGKNPNENWIEKMVNYIGRYISQRVGGDFK